MKHSQIDVIRARQLALYSAAAGLGAFSFGSQTQAEVVFTQVDPDVVVSSGAFDIDFDGDGFLDAAVVNNGFNVQVRSFGFDELSPGFWATDNITLSTLEDSAVPGTAYYVATFLPGTLIDGSALPIDDGAHIGVGNYNTIGTGGFVGFQFEIGNDPNEVDGSGFDRPAGSTTHFGWLEIDGGPGISAVVKSFAYETTPNVGIIAGDQGGLTGDLDADGFVGITDLNIVLGAWNQNVPPANALADPSGDGFVGIEDLNVVLGNWNAGTPPPPGNGAAIPEPTTLALLAAGTGAMGLRRRR